MEIARQDAKRILSDATGGFSGSVKFIPDRGDPITINALAIRIGISTDAGTGEKFIGMQSHVSVARSEFDWHNFPKEGWGVEFTRPDGRPLTLKVSYPVDDEALDIVTLFLKEPHA